MNQIIDLNEHKRRLVFEQLNLKTTKTSLETYLSSFQIESCIVPFAERGKNEGYGIVVFCKESSIDSLMAKRPHRIDGQSVEIYRSVPDQSLMKNTNGLTTLTVSGIKNRSLKQTDLEKYFSAYGTIFNIQINDQGDRFIIEFEDYDSVDKALLDPPHRIKQIDFRLTKGDEKNAIEQPPMVKSRLTASAVDLVPKLKKPDVKRVAIDSQITTVTIPNKTYCVHVTNLSANADAEILSRKFGWSIFYILMRPPSNDQHSSVECWVKNMNDKKAANDFAEHWKGQSIGGSKIHCEIEEEEPELCNQFRIGECPKTNEYCNWIHIPCTANGTCSIDCPYGHAPGTKPRRSNQKANISYRIRITGFQTKLTPDLLLGMLRIKNHICYINRNQDSIGYIVKLKTLRYAQDLMKKWHEKDIGENQKLKCQLELNPKSTIFGVPSKSEIALNNGDEHDNSSDSSDNDQSAPREVDDRDFNCEGRLFSRAVDSLGKQREPSVPRKAISTENVAPSVVAKYHLPIDVPANQWETTMKASGNGGKVLLIRSISDRKRLAVIKVYKNQINGDCDRELRALRILKGMQNVAQLIQPEQASNNIHRQGDSKIELWIITERAPGCSLKEFIDRKYHDEIKLFDAIQLVQKLIKIVKHIHSRGIFHRNLEPENIMIEWDLKHTSIDQAQLALLNFTQAYIKSDKNQSLAQSTTQRWYQQPQANVTTLKYTPTIDTSDICAILFWLLTKTVPRHDNDVLPHQQDDSYKKIIEAIHAANSKKKSPLKDKQLKTYLLDTFNSGFGSPGHQLWTIGDLECRLEAIHELLLPTNPKLDDVFQDFLSTYGLTVSSASIPISVNQGVLQKASDAFYQAKRYFLKCHQEQYSWSHGNCIWLDSAQNSSNEYRHDDILTYYSFKGNVTSNGSVIIICLANLSDRENVITLSIGSTINGKMIRIPLGRFSTNQDYVRELQDDFNTELKNLVISICKERKAKQE